MVAVEGAGVAVWLLRSGRRWWGMQCLDLVAAAVGSMGSDRFGSGSGGQGSTGVQTRLPLLRQ
jgi:hypothetical protein